MADIWSLLASEEVQTGGYKSKRKFIGPRAQKTGSHAFLSDTTNTEQLIMGSDGEIINFWYEYSGNPTKLKWLAPDIFCSYGIYTSGTSQTMTAQVFKVKPTGIILCFTLYHIKTITVNGSDDMRYAADPLILNGYFYLMGKTIKLRVPYVEDGRRYTVASVDSIFQSGGSGAPSSSNYSGTIIGGFVWNGKYYFSYNGDWDTGTDDVHLRVISIAADGTHTVHLQADTPGVATYYGITNNQVPLVENSGGVLLFTNGDRYTLNNTTSPVASTLNNKYLSKTAPNLNLFKHNNKIYDYSYIDGWLAICELNIETWTFSAPKYTEIGLKGFNFLENKQGTINLIFGSEDSTDTTKARYKLDVTSLIV